jgi:predicted DNA-binding protein with PD1-like motif
MGLQGSSDAVGRLSIITDIVQDFSGVDVEIAISQGAVLVRLGPGEDLHDAVHEAFEQSNRGLPIVTSCIGSLSHLEYGVAACDEQGIPGPGLRFLRADDAIEVGGIHGHVGVDAEDRPSAHLHGVMFGPDGSVMGGHVFVAKVLITMEFALLGQDAPQWVRVHRPVSGSPPLPLLIPRGIDEPR